MKFLFPAIMAILVIFFIAYYYPTMPPIQAIAVFNDPKIKGTVRFTESGSDILIDINITGLTPNHLHGFHVHEKGDLTDHCTSLCAHFNPYGKTHGCPGMTNRHVGDLGNIKADRSGIARYQMRDNIIKLRGSKSNIIGRGLVIHEDTDDCGQGGDEESLKTGNAGKRIACAIIGHA